MLRVEFNMTQQTYLFIDGGHIRRYYLERTRLWFNGEGKLNYAALKNSFGATKCFFYDCLDDIKRDDETENEFNQRLEKQETEFDTIREIHGTHIRLGSLTGSAKNKRQKKVDILLAVDMMNHATRRNMSKATLLSGDRDFEPVVESLVEMGLFVEVAGDERHTSKYLAHAADSYRKITFDDYISWSADSVKSKYPRPNLWTGRGMLNVISGGRPVKSGEIGKYRITLLEDYNKVSVHLIHDNPDQSHAYTLQNKDLDRLEKWVESLHGRIKWL